MADLAQARVTVHLPADDHGRHVTPGEVIPVDPSNPVIEGYLNMGYLVLLDPGPMADKLKPPRHRQGHPVEDDDARAVSAS